MDAVRRLIAAHGLPADFAALPWYRAIADAIVARAGDGPLLVGLCGSQGSGKSTMAAFLQALLDEAGLPTAILSIDDLYLDLPERIALAEAVHPLLRTRGVPGTHDVALGMQVIDALFAPGTAAIPRFAKANDRRFPPERWDAFAGPARIVILEGWCVGAAPQSAAELADPINALERDEDRDGGWRGYVNAALAGRYAELFGRIGLMLFLQAPSFDCVFAWRRLQETKLRQAAGGTGAGLMDDAALARFIMHYERITRALLATMPERADLVAVLDAQHRIVRLARREPAPQAAIPR